MVLNGLTYMQISALFWNYQSHITLLPKSPETLNGTYSTCRLVEKLNVSTSARALRRKIAKAPYEALKGIKPTPTRERICDSRACITYPQDEEKMLMANSAPKDHHCGRSFAKSQNFW